MIKRIFKSFLFNLILIFAFAVGLFFLILQLLGYSTRNNQYATVPDLIGKKTVDMVKLLESKGFEVKITDSVFTDTLERGIVIKQVPDANSKVKFARTVYLVVNRLTPPLITLPKIKDRTLREAIKILELNNMRIGETIYKPDFMKGAILSISSDGRILLDSGAKIPWGSTIDLLVGGGLEAKVLNVPDLVGLKFRDAKTIIESNGFTLGYPILDNGVVDTNNAFVYKQNPNTLNDDSIEVYVRPGSIIDLWVSNENKLGYTRTIADVIIKTGEAPLPPEDDDDDNDASEIFDRSGKSMTVKKKRNKKSNNTTKNKPVETENGEGTPPVIQQPEGNKPPEEKPPVENTPNPPAPTTGGGSGG